MVNSWSQKIRSVLDAPLSRKGIFFYVLLPLLFFVSFFISFVAKKRRQKSYQTKENIGIKNENLKIICVGNISLGGSGKSPVVQALARKHLSDGCVVGIAARGITDVSGPVYVNSQNRMDTDGGGKLDLLSDENREHYEILKREFPDHLFFVLQNKDRSEALKFFSNKVKNKKSVLILDDGLQHFSCPRDVNFCVWNPRLLLNAPQFALPVGPYREGFGHDSFTRLLTQFDFRIWSRTDERNFSAFLDDIHQALKIHGIKVSAQDMIARYKLKRVQDDGFLDGKNNEIPFILTGIAYPENFIQDLKSEFPDFKDHKSLFLSDHADLNSQAIAFIKSGSHFIFTAKDFFRWIKQPVFRKLIDGKKIMVLSVEVELDGSPLSRE